LVDGQYVNKLKHAGGSICHQVGCHMLITRPSCVAHLGNLMLFAWEIQNLWRMLRTLGIKLGANWHVIPTVALHYTSVVMEELLMMAYLGGQSTLARFHVRWEIENPWGHKQSRIRVLVVSKGRKLMNKVPPARMSFDEICTPPRTSPYPSYIAFVNLESTL
jgi:hypothetical protein